MADGEENKILLDNASSRAKQSKSPAGDDGQSNFSVHMLRDSLTKMRSDITRGVAQFARHDQDQPSQLSLKRSGCRSQKPVKRRSASSVNSILLNPLPKATAATGMKRQAPLAPSQSLYSPATPATSLPLVPPPPPPPPLPLLRDAAKSKHN